MELRSSHETLLLWLLLILLCSSVIRTLEAHWTSRPAETGRSLSQGYLLLTVVISLILPTSLAVASLALALVLTNTGRQAVSVAGRHVSLILLVGIVHVLSGVQSMYSTAALLVCITLDIASLNQCQLLRGVAMHQYVAGQCFLSGLMWMVLLPGLDSLAFHWLFCKLGAAIGLCLLPSMYTSLTSGVLPYVGVSSLYQSLILVNMQCTNGFALSTLAAGGSLLGLAGVVGWLASGLFWTSHSYILSTSTGTCLTLVALATQLHSTWVTGLVINTALTWVLLVGVAATSDAPQ
jgi:hypothetical protein